MENLSGGQWSKEQILELFVQGVGGFHSDSLQLQDPGEKGGTLSGVSDTFFSKLLTKQTLNPFVKDMLSRRVVRETRTGPQGLVVDVRDVDPVVLNDHLEQMGDGTVVDQEVKKVTLSQVLRDDDAMSRYGFSFPFRRMIEKVAGDRPAEAAAMAKRGFEARGYPNISVPVGNYTRGAKKAGLMIKQLTLGVKGFNPAYTEVIGEQIFFHYVIEGVTQWVAQGDIKCTESVYGMYKLACQKGPAAAVLLLGLEVEILNITLWNALDDTCYNSTIVHHVSIDGIEPLGPEEVDRNRSSLTVQQRVSLAELGQRVQPVSADGLIVASAVQVTGKFAVMCEHVINDLAGKEARIGSGGFVPQRAVATDLWFVQSERPLVSTWRLREANSGELAVYCYAGPGGMEYSSPVAVVNTDGRTIVTVQPPEARPGMSGAALVALTDMALLGLYRGESGIRSVVSAFLPTHFADIGELVDSRSVVTADDAHYGDTVVAQLETRGYGAVLKGVFSSMRPLLVDGVHSAVAVCMAASSTSGQKVFYVAPDPPDDGVFRYMDGKAPAFDRADQGRCVTDAPAHSSIVPVLRRPRVDEKVILLGVGPDGAYVTRPTVVTRVAVGGERFTVGKVDESSPLYGCVVLAWSDACVLGQLVASEKKKRVLIGYSCAGSYVPPEADTGAELVRALSEAVRDVVTPMIWQRDQLLRVFTHPDGKDDVIKLASVGDAHAKGYATRALFQRGIPTYWWTLITSRTLSNASWIVAYESMHLDDLVRHGTGAIPPGKGSKYGADLVEALIGMTVIYEGFTAADKLCEFLGAATIPVDIAERMTEIVPGKFATGPEALSLPVSPLERLGEPWVRTSWHGGIDTMVSKADMAAELEKLRSRSVSPVPSGVSEFVKPRPFGREDARSSTRGSQASDGRRRRMSASEVSVRRGSEISVD